MPFDASEINPDVFAKEILSVCKSLEELDIDLERQPLGAEQPYWLGTPSIRERILIGKFYEQTGTSEEDQKDKADLYLVCAASFDIDTNYKNFDVDHFFPKDEILKRLEKLESNNPKILEILKQTKKKLLEQGISQSVADKLITLSAENIPNIRGLKLIYYNYPKNLEPISRTSNVSKGSREPIENLIYISLTKLYNLTQDEQYIMSIVRKDGITLQADNIDDYIKQVAKEIKNNLEATFVGKYAVIPHDDQVRSMLEVFKNTNVGKVCENYARETSRNIRNMLLLTRDLVGLSRSDDPEIRKKAERGEKAVEIFRKALVENLEIEASPVKGRLSEGTTEFIETLAGSMIQKATEFKVSGSSNIASISQQMTAFEVQNPEAFGVKTAEPSSSVRNKDPVAPPTSKPKPNPKPK